jgi:hypothetical protein
MRKQRVSVRLGAGDDLRPDLTGGAGLGLDDHWLLQDRLHHGGQRPGHDVVDAARRKRVDDRDCVRRESFLRECGASRDKRARADHETTAIHLAPPENSSRPSQL